MRIAIVGLAAALAVAVSSCTFSRTVTNAGRRNLDLSFIELDETTWQEVLARLGPPDVAIRDLRSFVYTRGDQRQSGVTIGSFLVLPFSWSDRQDVEEVLIELDVRGYVEHVVRSRRGAIRPPLESPGSRPPLVNEVDLVRSQP